MSTVAFRIARLRRELRPFRLHWFPRLGSTNTHAAALRRRGDLFAPAVVLAGRQTAGRGRGAHSWWSGAGCLTVTFVLPADARSQAHRVPLLAGLAVRRAAAEAAGSDAVLLKWPNDLVVAAGPPTTAPLRKLAGLLCERVQGADLIGLGLNVNLNPATAPGELRDRVASLSELAGRPLDLTDTLVTVARHVRRVLAGDADSSEVSFADVLREYDSHHALVGRTIDVLAGDAAPLGGRCEGLDGIGRLLLRRGSTVHRVIAGQVVLR